MCWNRDPVHCIVPPHMLDRMVESGDGKARGTALRMIKQSQHVRAQRGLIQDQHPAQTRDLLASALDSHSPEKVRQVFDARHREELPGALARGEGDAPAGQVREAPLMQRSLLQQSLSGRL